MGGPETMTSTSTSTIDCAALDLKRIAEVIHALPPDPLAQQMAAAGFDPRHGGLLIMPESYQSADWGPFGPPRYVLFSSVVSVPTYGRDQRLDAVVGIP